MRGLLVCAAVMAFASGCSSGSTAEPDRFLRKADAICGEFGRQVNAVPLPAGNPKFMLERSRRGRALRRQILVYDSHVRRLGEAAFARIHRLQPPSSLSVRWRRWLAEADAAHRAGTIMNRDLHRLCTD